MDQPGKRERMGLAVPAALFLCLGLTFLSMAVAAVGLTMVPQTVPNRTDPRDGYPKNSQASLPNAEGMVAK